MQVLTSRANVPTSDGAKLDQTLSKMQTLKPKNLKLKNKGKGKGNSFTPVPHSYVLPPLDITRDTYYYSWYTINLTAHYKIQFNLPHICIDFSFSNCATSTFPLDIGVRIV